MRFSFSTYFPTTPSKADWRSLAGRVSWRDPAYNKHKTLETWHSPSGDYKKYSLLGCDYPQGASSSFLCWSGTYLLAILNKQGSSNLFRSHICLIPYMNDFIVKNRVNYQWLNHLLVQQFFTWAILLLILISLLYQHLLPYPFFLFSW